MSGRVASRYAELVVAGAIRRDAVQEAAAVRLDAVINGSPRGLYLHGSVGVGKSFLMDTAYECADTSKQRYHFHSFMLETHRRLHEARQRCGWGRGGDAPAMVADEIAGRGALLCFDEFQVTDIADAMILRGLFEGLWERGTVMIATSNRAPDGLYEGGLNRSAFLPFIDLLRAKCDVHELAGPEDYRLAVEAQPGMFLVPHDGAAQARLAALFDGAEGEAGPCDLPSGPGRTIAVPRARGSSVCWFTFAELCAAPTGAADFAALAQRFDTIILSAVPLLTSRERNEARRFITLIDAAYEHGVRLVCSAQAPIDELFTALALEVVADEDSEEKVADGAYWPGSDQVSNSPGVAVRVAAEGGASGRSSTHVGDVEWSATGRMKVSLAELASVREVGFAFSRARSRLHEMQGKDFARRRAQW